MATPPKPTTRAQLLSEAENLRGRLEEAEETLQAIRSGEVDALVINGPQGRQIFTLKGAEHGYRVLIETMTEGAATLRDEGTIYYCNARLAAMIKMPLEKVIGLRLQQFIPSGEASHFEALLAQNEQDRRHEFTLVSADGTLRPVLLAMSALTEESAGSVCVVITDLSVQKHAATLEQLVRDRTDQLRQKIAELETFSYSISHDLRQPLRAMRGYAEAVLEDYGETLALEPKDFIGRIKRSADRLERLIHDVLTYSHATRDEHELSAIKLGDIVREVVENYPNLRNAKIEITSPMPLVLGAEVGLTQSISNLLSNAVKFVPAGKTPEIKMWSEARGGFTRLWIADNGIGIAAADQKNLFVIFSRVHDDQIYEGTGIGLSIVKKSAEKMGGQVGVESELGKGSRFWIELQTAEQAESVKPAGTGVPAP